jgi:hypothetical protein
VEGTEQLLTIAEIGATFAGFTGVIGVLGRTPGNAVPAVTRARFWLMIEFSIAAIFFALIPFAVFNFTEPSEGAVWTISSAIMAAFVVAHMFLGGRWSTLDVAVGVVASLGAARRDRLIRCCRAESDVERAWCWFPPFVCRVLQWTPAVSALSGRQLRSADGGGVVG